MKLARICEVIHLVWFLCNRHDVVCESDVVVNAENAPKHARRRTGQWLRGKLPLVGQKQHEAPNQAVHSQLIVETQTWLVLGGMYKQAVPIGCIKKTTQSTRVASHK